MDIKEIRKLSDSELVKEIQKTKEELFTKRMQQASGTLERPYELNKLRKDVAKMKTVLTERKLDGGNK